MTALLLVMAAPAAAQFPASGPHSVAVLTRRVNGLRDCVVVLNLNEQTVLKAMFGLGGPPPLSPSGAALQLNLTLTQLSERVLRAVRALEAHQMADECPVAAARPAGAVAGAGPYSIPASPSGAASLPLLATGNAPVRSTPGAVAVAAPPPALTSPTSLVLIALIVGSALTLIWALRHEFRR